MSCNCQVTELNPGDTIYLYGDAKQPRTLVGLDIATNRIVLSDQHGSIFSVDFKDFNYSVEYTETLADIVDLWTEAFSNVNLITASPAAIFAGVAEYLIELVQADRLTK